MFETVLPESFHTRSRRVFYETLPVSVAVHALAIAGAVTAALWNVVFPTASPRVSVAYSLTSVPDPPPPPPPPKPQEAAKPEVKNVPPPPPVPLAQITAPTVIPELIPQVVEPPPPVSIPVQPVTETAVLPSASPDGVLGGDILGKVHGTLGGIPFPEDGRVHIERGEKMPMETVQQDPPLYPSEAQKKRIEGQVVVRYIVGTNGRVTSVEILSKSGDPMLDEAAVEAIKKWRFRPMIKDGKKVEVTHDLAVNFEIVMR